MLTRLQCYFCKKPVSSEIEDETIIRAVIVCPECAQQRVRGIKEEQRRVQRERAKQYGQDVKTTSSGG